MNVPFTPGRGGRIRTDDLFVPNAALSCLPWSTGALNLRLGASGCRSLSFIADQ